ncbi:hypothetical protein BDF14DRAFT_1729766 [Spinellus fusiger]|nr:hypothetical protein BDF14DRAFT_1729766 [Spinellus fusiger]
MQLTDSYNRFHPVVSQDDSDIDTRPWQRVLGKLSFLSHSENEDQKHHNDSATRDDLSLKESMEDDNDMYELTASSARRYLRARKGQSLMTSTMEDDALPSPHELKDQAVQVEKPNDDDNGVQHSYFARPFLSDRDQKPMPSATSSGAQARHQWMKTLDKVRLITNIHHHQQQHIQQQPRGRHPHPHHPHHLAELPPNKVHSLAPWCPPVVEPVFLAFSRDQHRRKLVAIVDSELQTKGLNQWVFRVELQYGDVRWVLRKTITDFVSLHYTLKFKSNLSGNVPAPPNFPSQFQNWLSSAKTTMGISLDRDSNEPQTDNEKKDLALHRRRALTKYLCDLLMRAHMLVNYDICEFLEISAISIVQDMGWKGKEGYLENRINFVTPRVCSNVLRPHLWTKEWVIVRDSYIAFLSDIASTVPTDVLMLDKSFQVTNRKPGLLGRYHNHIILSNRFRKIEIKGSKRQVEEWMESIKKVSKESPWVKNHRFGSFAPVRHHAKAKWFVDGEDHFNAVAEAILAAKKEIYISDWWLSPELYLRRPPELNHDFRLDRLLKRKAQEGVMVYVIVYKEMSVALTINSAHTKQWLQNLHPNIIVQRHPDHRSIDNTVLFWSHHEKMVIVDNRIAFIGGLDLCWGRYDTHAHQLADYPSQDHPYEIFPGQDYSNPRVKDFVQVTNYDLTLTDRQITPRMPWHDATLGVVGPIARDVARHFIQRWNFLKTSKGMHRPTVPFLMPKGEYVAERDENRFEGSCRVQLLRSSAQWSSGIEREHSIYNAYMECITKAKHYVYIENQFFISATTQDKILRNKIGQAMVERIKDAHKKREKFKIFIMIPLIPAFEGDLASSEATSARNVMHYQYLSISRGGNSILEKLREANINPDEYIGWYSLRNWDKISCRDKAKARDIHGGGEGAPISIAQECPSSGSLGDPAEEGCAVPRSTHQPSSSSSDNTLGPTDTGDRRMDYVSELVYIHDKIMIVDDRIVLIGSEMIPSYMNGKEYKAAKFAHSLRMQLWKEHLGLLNFKDWSALCHSSPIDLPPSPSNPTTITVLEEESLETLVAKAPDIVLDSERRSHSAEIPPSDEVVLLKQSQALDPLSDQCYYHVWRKTAHSNTTLYRDLFHCVPDDTVHTFEQHRQFIPDPMKVPHGHIANPDTPEHEIQERLGRVHGHLVEFPIHYLRDENMLGSYIRETVTPMIIFT